MNLSEIFSNMNMGGVVSILVILMTLIQVVPCKIDPWTWLGDQLNKNMTRRMDKMEKHVDEMDVKLNAHIVESYRTSILDFADKVMSGQQYTLDKWRQMQKVCHAYENFIKDEGLLNGDATEAIAYLNRTFKKLSETGNFIGFPKDENTN